jgi:hypothetical protein
MPLGQAASGMWLGAAGQPVDGGGQHPVNLVSQGNPFFDDGLGQPVTLSSVAALYLPQKAPRDDEKANV